MRVYTYESLLRVLLLYVYTVYTLSMLLLVLLYSYIDFMCSGAIVYLSFFIIYSVYVCDGLYSILLSYRIVNVVTMCQFNGGGISVKDSLYTGDFHICI